MAQILNPKPRGKNFGIDPSDRRRSWLDDYEASRWTVRDTAGEGEDQVVDFDVRMADGRSLLQHPDLYATAKELLFWIRAGNYTRFDDAYRHKQYANTILRLCYGLTARGFYSFGALTSIDIDMICAEAAFGVDGLTRSSEITKSALAQYRTWADVPPELANDNEFNLKAVIDTLKLPLRWARAEIKSEVSVATARLNGEIILSIAALKEEPITIQNIQLLTMVFEALFALRDFIEATCISFRPFREGAAQRAVELGRASTRTPVPPPELAMRLLENTTRYLVSHEQQVIKTYREVIDSRDEPEWSRSRAEEVGTRVRSLVTASYILIAAFTARRAEEIKLLLRDCVQGSDQDGYWMRIYIEKTERQLTWIPIPTLVARAVEAIRALTPEAETTSDALLFQYREPLSGKVFDLSPELNLISFSESINAREYANDNDKQPQQWDWASRQFRRLFAVMFFYRYRGKIETLAHHLRHFDSRMTNDYVTKDPEVAKMWDQEVWRHQIEIARDIVSGRVTYSGAMGNRLTQLVNRLRQKFSEKTTVVSEAAAAVLVRQLRKGQNVLTPKLWVTCSCPRNKKACEKAACRKLAGFDENDIGPDFSAAGPTVCVDCPFAMIGPENIVYIDEQTERMNASAKGLATNGPTIFGELQAAHALKLTGVSDDLKVA